MSLFALSLSFPRKYLCVRKRDLLFHEKSVFTDRLTAPIKHGHDGHGNHVMHLFFCLLRDADSIPLSLPISSPCSCCCSEIRDRHLYSEKAKKGHSCRKELRDLRMISRVTRRSAVQIITASSRSCIMEERRMSCSPSRPPLASCRMHSSGGAHSVTPSVSDECILSYRTRCCQPPFYRRVIRLQLCPVFALDL